MTRPEPELLRCSRCGRGVGEWLYHRFVGNRYNAKPVCLKCLKEEELDWRDRLILELRRTGTVKTEIPKKDPKQKEIIETEELTPQEEAELLAKIKRPEL